MSNEKKVKAVHCFVAHVEGKEERQTLQAVNTIETVQTMAKGEIIIVLP